MVRPPAVATRGSTACRDQLRPASMLVNAKPSDAPKACVSRRSMCGAWRPACIELHLNLPPGKSGRANIEAAALKETLRG